MEGRVLFYGIWGIGVFILFTVVLYRRWGNHRRHHDARSKRDFLEAVGLWLVACAASFAVGAALIESTRSTIPGALSLLSLGAFFGVGVFMATEDPKPQ